MLAGCREPILHDLAESEANRLISRLSQIDVASEKVIQADGRWSLAVGHSDTVKALTFIDGSRILARRPEGGGVVPNSGFLPSREENWLRYQRALAASVEGTLGSMPGVIEARVHLNLEQSDPILGRRDRTPGSGSVLLLVDGFFSSSNDEVASLVGGAAGLDPTLIKVLRSNSLGNVEQKIPDKPAVVALDAGPPAALVSNLPVGRMELAATGGILLVGIVLMVRYRRSLRTQNPFLLEREA